MIDVSKGVPGVNAPKPTSYREFWPYYLSQHLHPMTEKVHAGATTGALLTGLVGFVRRSPRQTPCRGAGCRPAGGQVLPRGAGVRGPEGDPGD